MSGLSISKNIFQILSNDDELKKMVKPIEDKNGNKKDNIYPIIAEEDAILPYVVYTRTAIRPSYYKVGVAKDDVTFQIQIYGNDYITTVTIAERIRELFELRHTEPFQRIELSNCTETYTNDVYLQTLQFIAVI